MDIEQEAQELRAQAVETAKLLVRKFNRSWGAWEVAQHSRLVGSNREDTNRDRLMNQVCSLFATVMQGVNVETELSYVEAGIEKGTGNYAFLVFTPTMIAYCSATPEENNLIGDPKMTLIPRSQLQKLEVAGGMRLGTDFTYVRDNSVVLNLEYGGPTGRTFQLPLDEKAGFDRSADAPLPVDVALLKLLPGLMEDLDRK